ncbi:hypothetical protein GCM10010508_31700 [Streptomyces naganishii JCM 4654]|uniref:Uncharacterized protein n=1 Tax=Streptomyces naganishii JCM 4654 TaxID=1306179 RepID=A0A918Y4T2_9ACTN|nr:hypothetical protein GCM10010508_31700 [Streptomyces naganishii JCM 4654]
MKTSTADIDSGLVDLSGCGLREAMALSGPLITRAEELLLGELTREAVGQSAGGPNAGRYSSARCDASDD